MMYTAQSRFDDIDGRSVLDLGSGCGMLSIASIYMGAAFNAAIEIDPDAISMCTANMNRCFGDDDDAVDLIQADVTTMGLSRRGFTFDTVVLNPPFGTKNNQGIDMIFLQQALRMSEHAVYSMHKSSTRSYIERRARESWNVNVEVIAQMSFDLPRSYAFHKRDSLSIEVDLIRFEHKQ